LKNIVQLISAVVIIFEHSFYIFDKRRYLQDQQESAPSFYVALDQYMASSHAAAVRKAVSIAVQAYEAAVRPPPTWKAKLPFKRFNKNAKEASERSEEEKEYLCSQAKAELMKTVLETTLNHRLARP
jgi:acyl-CoA reductase-like NAD-dependent aldehyde dehydrogenase